MIVSVDNEGTIQVEGGAAPSKTSVNFCQATGRHVPEDISLQMFDSLSENLVETGQSATRVLL